MVDWAAVGAFTGPLVGAVGLSAGWFTYLGRKRDERVTAQIRAATAALESQQAVTQERLGHVESKIEAQGRDVSAALQSIARIEGRLSGQAASTVS